MQNEMVKNAYSLLKAAAANWGIELTAVQVEQIDRFLHEILTANQKVNLTADTDPQVILLRHIADGLAAAGVLIKEANLPNPRILDLGSGGGYIGMAVKIAWPQARVTLMESLQRKYRFLNAMAVRSGLPGLSVCLSRAGEGRLPAAQTDFDAVLARALAPLPEALGLAIPLAAAEGSVLIFQSQAPDPEEPLLKSALARHGARLVKSIPYRLPQETHDRYLALFRR